MDEGKILFAQYGVLSGLDALVAWGDGKEGDFVFEHAKIKGLKLEKKIAVPTVEIILRVSRS